MSDGVVVQALLQLEDGRAAGFRLGLAAAALLAPGALGSIVLPYLGTIDGGALLVATTIASAGAAVVALRDHLLVSRPTAQPGDVRELLAARLEERLAELSSVPAMALMAAAVCLVVVMTALVGFSPPAPGLGWLTFLGAATALLMVGNLAWTWTVEVPRLSATLDDLRDLPARR